MTLGVEEVPKDETLRKFARHAGRIFRKYLSKISELGYGEYGNRMGYFARGIDEKERDTMALVGFLVARSEKPNLLKITRFPGNKPKFVHVYTEGEKKDMWDVKYSWETPITRFILPKDEFEGQARAFSGDYDQKPPYSELLHLEYNKLAFLSR